VRVLGLNAVLATVWAAVMGNIDLANLATGFVFSYLVLWLLRPILGETAYFRKLPQAIGFVAYFLKELALSNIRVARDVLSLHPRRRPGVVAVPLDLTRDFEITLLANLLTLTPGSLSLDISEDRRTLYVHVMFIEDPEDVRREIKDGFELRIMELFR
jgi:multicomponent Na+:H+ antiporter subunit E